MQIKTIQRQNFSPTRLTKILKFDNICCWLPNLPEQSSIWRAQHCFLLLKAWTFSSGNSQIGHSERRFMWLGPWRASTLPPCPLCSQALEWSRKEAGDIHRTNHSMHVIDALWLALMQDTKIHTLCPSHTFTQIPLPQNSVYIFSNLLLA